jgi:hypothetical protein
MIVQTREQGIAASVDHVLIRALPLHCDPADPAAVDCNVSDAMTGRLDVAQHHGALSHPKE